jgi:hypothetical protein
LVPVLVRFVPYLLLSISRGSILCRERLRRRNAEFFEKVPGSDIWWVRYYIDGKERREKVGRRGDAIKLYKVRKTDALRGVKLPNNMKHKGVRFKAIAQEAIDWYINHNRKDVRNFKGRMQFILEAFGDRVAPMRSSRLRSTRGWVLTSGRQLPRIDIRMSLGRRLRSRSPMAR